MTSGKTGTKTTEIPNHRPGPIRTRTAENPGHQDIQRPCGAIPKLVWRYGPIGSKAADVPLHIPGRPYSTKRMGPSHPRTHVQRFSKPPGPDCSWQRHPPSPTTKEMYSRYCLYRSDSRISYKLTYSFPKTFIFYKK